MLSIELHGQTENVVEKKLNLPNNLFVSNLQNGTESLYTTIMYVLYRA